LSGGLVPKHKTSRARTRHRRSKNIKLTPPALAACPRCKQPTLQHHACATCGFYRGREYPEAITLS
jgi:large subunit ribosomal protein L32